jgi:CDP-diacylglycerol--serine O-phosphatidyltransferase
MRHQIPNFFTLSNLFFGCCAMVLLLYGQPVSAAWCLLGSFFCDYSDGMVARALRVSSPMGKELDSLADVVSFGVVPGVMLYSLLSGIYCESGDVVSYPPASALPADANGYLPICPAALPAFVLSMFSAYRLAKFNLDLRQKSYFIGLSTPACTLFVLGLTLAVHQNQFGIGAFIQRMPWVLYLLTGVFSFLLVSEIPMFPLKFRSFRWQGNKMPYTFLVLGLTALFTLKAIGMSVLIVFYIVVSLFFKHKITGSEKH